MELTATARDHLSKAYPDRVPVFVRRGDNCKDLPELKKQKFLVPRELTVGQFLFIVRRQLTLPPEKALFIFINNTLPPATTLMGEVYAKHKSSDGALRMIFMSESTFGDAYNDCHNYCTH